MHLTPFEVLMAINHTQMRLKRNFKEEEFSSGKVGKLMIAEDFNFETTMSLLQPRTRVSSFTASTSSRTRVHGFH